MSRQRILLLSLFLLSASLAAAHAEIHANPERMEQHIKELSAFGANADGGVDRVAFSEADLTARSYIRDLMREAGLTVRLDTAGNIIGRREGSEIDLSVIMFGSHIDSVPGGGNYDGDVGVIGAIEVIQLLQDNGIRTRHPLEVVSFTDEEGGLTGSRAMIGKVDDRMRRIIAKSADDLGLSFKFMPSGAGHDAQNLALINRPA